MIQAARSGKQNIVEGCSERTSEKSELKLLGVARASFQELLEDYEDYLRQHNLKLWPKDDPRVSELRRIAYLSNKTYKSYSSYLMLPETAGNCLLCLLHQTNYLLDQQIKRAESDFIARGGHTEQLFRKRLNSR